MKISNAHSRLPMLAWILALVASPLVVAETPKVLLICGDDVGYGDVGAYGAEKIPTPNIDRLAGQGLRFTDSHCVTSTCTTNRSTGTKKSNPVPRRLASTAISSSPRPTTGCRRFLSRMAES